MCIGDGHRLTREEGIKPKDATKALASKFSCGVAGRGKADEIDIQGDFKKDLPSFLQEKWNVRFADVRYRILLCAFGGSERGELSTTNENVRSCDGLFHLVVVFGV